MSHGQIPNYGSWGTVFSWSGFYCFTLFLHMLWASPEQELSHDSKKRQIWLLIPSCQTHNLPAVVGITISCTSTLYNLLPWHHLKDYRMPNIMAHYAAPNSAHKDFLQCSWKLGETTVTWKITSPWDVALCLIYSRQSNTLYSKHPVPKELKLQIFFTKHCQEGRIFTCRLRNHWQSGYLVALVSTRVSRSIQSNAQDFLI